MNGQANFVALIGSSNFKIPICVLYALSGSSSHYTALCPARTTTLRLIQLIPNTGGVPYPQLLQQRGIVFAPEPSHFRPSQAKASGDSTGNRITPICPNLSANDRQAIRKEKHRLW